KHIDAFPVPALVGLYAKEVVAVTALLVGDHVFAPAGFQRGLGNNGAGVNAQFGANGLGVRVHSGNEVGRSGKLLPLAAVTAGDSGRCGRADCRFSGAGLWGAWLARQFSVYLFQGLL